MKEWLRKWWLLLALFAASLLLISTWSLKPSASRTSPPYHVGPPLPPGRVQPQLLVKSDFIVMLAPDGSLWAWGGATLGSFHSVLNLTAAPTAPLRIGTDADWRRVTTTGHGLLAIKADGSLWGMGYDLHSTLLTTPHKVHHNPLFRIGTDTDWMDVTTDGGHVLAKRRDGSIWSWGNNWSGQVGNGTSSNVVGSATRISSDTNWTAIACGRNNSFALKADGTLWGWGEEPAGNGILAIAPMQLDTATNWSTISAAAFHVAALRTDGTLWVLGTLDHSTIFKSFTQLGTNSGWMEIVCGSGQTFARKSDGSWWVCGQTSTGAFATGRLWDSAPLPVPLPFPLQASALAAGRSVAALSPDGRLWTWGQQPSAPARFARWARWEGFVERLNKMSSWFHGPILVDMDEYPCDTFPVLAWELPPSMKTALGTTTPGLSKPAP